MSRGIVPNALLLRNRLDTALSKEDHYLVRIANRIVNTLAGEWAVLRIDPDSARFHPAYPPSNRERWRRDQGAHHPETSPRAADGHRSCRPPVGCRRAG